MRVRVPAPIHGWRAFAGEVGIVVLGVLLALGAGQIVDQWQWSRKVATIRNSLSSELSNDRARWEWDVTSTACAIRQIDALDVWLRQGAPGRPLPDTSAIDARGLFLWMHSANWTLATSSNALDHFPIEDQLAYAAMYDGIAHRQVELEKVTDLMAQVGTLLPFVDTAARRQDLRLTLAALKSKRLAVISDADYMRRHFDALGVRSDQRDFASDIRSSACRS